MEREGSAPLSLCGLLVLPEQPYAGAQARQGAASMTDSTESTLKPPLDVASVMALGVVALMAFALTISIYIADKELTRDLAKNFVGPGFLLILGFYFGASSSGKRKDETIAAQSQQIIEASK